MQGQHTKIAIVFNSSRWVFDGWFCCVCLLGKDMLIFDIYLMVLRNNYHVFFWYIYWAVFFSFIHIYGKHKKRGIMEVYIWENSVFLWLKLRLWSKCRSSPVKENLGD